MSGDRTQERTEGPVQDIRPAAEEDQAVRAMRKPIAEEVASRLEVETGNSQESLSAKPEAEVADTGGKNAFIQGLHGDYIVIF